MNTFFVTPAFYKNIKVIEPLAYSCRKNGVRLHLLGEGQKWRGFVDAKIFKLYELLVKYVRPKGMFTHVCLLDADSYVLSCEEEINAKYLDMCKDDEILISTEPHPYPLGYLGPKFTEPTKGYRYINSGGYIGPIDEVISTLRFIMEVANTESTESGDPWCDQALWSHCYVYYLGNLILDHCGVVFQTFSNINLNECKLFNGRLINHNNYLPCVLHFNGKSKGLKEIEKHVESHYARSRFNGTVGTV